MLHATVLLVFADPRATHLFLQLSLWVAHSSKGVNRTQTFLHNSKLRAGCPRLCFLAVFIKIDVYIFSPTSNRMSSMMA